MDVPFKYYLLAAAVSGVTAAVESVGVAVESVATNSVVVESADTVDSASFGVQATMDVATIAANNPILKVFFIVYFLS